MSRHTEFFNRKKNELNVSLNEIQQKAVLHTEGPLLLLASPGSGKTTTMIMRIGYLIEEKAIEPHRIKAVTFSRASANDMKGRFKRFFPELPPVDFSTIHSLAFEIVREHFWKMGTPYQIIEGDVDTEEQEDLDADQLPMHKRIILRKIYRSVIGENITDDQLDELTSYISFIKNKMIPEQEWHLVKVGVKETVRIVQEYESFKRTGHSKLLLDFDDMLTISNEVLEQDPKLLRKYGQRYDYVLTDESQDTSLVQHAIIEKLVKGHRNLCVVADDDQSIYSWRGAEPSYLLNFKDNYKGAAVLYMEQNYRSSKDIVLAANKFIKRNKNRYDKNMFTNNLSDHPVQFKTLVNYKEQSTYLVKEIQKLDNLSEVAVLYRNNSSSIALMNAFDRAGIPFYMKDVDNRFFSHWVVEDILNFMRMTFTDKRSDILEKIHLKLNGYISKGQMATLKEIENNESVFDNLIQHVPLKDYQTKLIVEAKETFQEMKGMPPLQAIRVIRSRLGYEKSIERMCERLGFRKEYLIGIMNTLEDIAEGLPTMESYANRLKVLEAALKSSKARRGQNAVTFSTFHSAKGLEFDSVYMIDLIDGIIPSREDSKNMDVIGEEAVRLFYVGMTRARKHLELISYQERDGEKAAESPFLAAVRNIVNPTAIIAKPVKSNVGSRNVSVIMQERRTAVPPNPNAITSSGQLGLNSIVKHGAFGQGEVINIDKEFVEIEFGQGVKKLSLKACLEIGLLEPVGQV